MDPMTWQDWALLVSIAGSAWTAFTVFFQLRIDVEILRKAVEANEKNLAASETRIETAMVRGFAMLETRLEVLLTDIREIRARQ